MHEDITRDARRYRRLRTRGVQFHQGGPKLTFDALDQRVDADLSVYPDLGEVAADVEARPDLFDARGHRRQWPS